MAVIRDSNWNCWFKDFKTKKMEGKMKKFISVILFMVFIPVSTAMGNYYMDFAKPIEEGDLSIGVAKTDLKREFEENLTIILSDGSSGTDSINEELEYEELIGAFGYGISETGQLQVKFGNISIKTENPNADDYSGTLIGVGYRHLFGGKEEELAKGLLFQYLMSDFENNIYTGKLTEIDIGFGISNRSSEDFVIFGGLILSQVSGEVNAKDSFLRDIESQLGYSSGIIKSVKWELEGANELGIVLGGEFFIDESMSVGIEIHNTFESGIVIIFEADL